MRHRATPYSDDRYAWQSGSWLEQDDGRERELLERRSERFRRVGAVAGAFLGLYLLYVVLAAVAPDFMGTLLFGRLSVGLVCGLLLCAVTAGVVQWYVRFAATHLDPLSEGLRAHREGVR